MLVWWILHLVISHRDLHEHIVCERGLVVVMSLMWGHTDWLHVFLWALDVLLQILLWVLVDLLQVEAISLPQVMVKFVDLGLVVLQEVDELLQQWNLRMEANLLRRDHIA